MKDDVIKSQIEPELSNDAEVRQLVEDVVKATAAFERTGNPDLEAEQCQRAVELGISDAGIVAQWQEAKANRRKASQIWVDGRRLPKLLGPPKPKPKETEKIEEVDEGLPKIEAALRLSEKLISEKPAQPLEQPQAGVSPEVKQRAMLRFNPAKNPFNQNGFENGRIALGLMELDCALDLFHHKPVIRGKHAWLGGDGFEDLDNVALKLRQMILDEFCFDPKEKGVFDALRARCLDNAFDPLLDYLDSLQWDGVPRLDRWLTTYCSADDTPLNRAIGRKVLIAAVRRARHPGCKFDYLLVLEGEQGIGKSTAVKILAGGDDYYSDKAIIGCDAREQQESIQGVWFYEIAELQGLSKVDMAWMKMFISHTHDKARPAFGRSVVDRPRRGVMIGTTNDETYLRDTTGNRRWWPVKLNGRIDLAGLQTDRDQLFAEAVVAEASGESLVIPEPLWGAAAREQQARMEIDAWLEPIADRLTMLEGKRANQEGKFWSDCEDKQCALEFRVSSAYLLGEVLDIGESHRGQRESKRLADVMRTLGWRLAQYPIKVGKKTCRAYTKPHPIEEEGAE